jgi:hypothetical protein
MPFLRILEKDLQMHIIGAKKVVHHHACFIKKSSTQNCKKKPAVLCVTKTSGKPI